MTPAVKLYDLADALQTDSEAFGVWLDWKTGGVIIIESEVMDAVESEEEDKLVDWQKEELAAARAISAGDSRYVALPTQFDFHEYRYMEKFVGTVADAGKADQLRRAIKGKGAFRHFKDTARRLDLIDDWYRYREAAMNEFMLRWAEVNQIPVDQTPRRPVRP